MSLSPRKRTQQLLDAFSDTRPRLSLERAKFFTESFRTTEHLPVTLRWAKAVTNVLNNISVDILPGELLVGRAGPRGRYGIFYPELEGNFFSSEAAFEDNPEILSQFDEADRKIISEELLPFWSGRTFRESLAGMVPPELKRLLYKDSNIYSPSFIIHETATVRHSLQWVPDYQKVLSKGFRGICMEAEERLNRLDINNPDNCYDKAPFYRAVIILCHGIRHFALRYSRLASSLVQTCTDSQRKKELELIADICSRIPWLPAQNFHEALQAQWFTQLVSRIEQQHGAIVSNGRMDQYLYPYYLKDIEAGSLDNSKVLELLDCLWCSIAQFIRVQPTAAGIQIYENHAHWEQVTIGGQSRQGTDAANRLSALLLQSKKEFPLNYPYMGLRVHKATSRALLDQACAAISSGKGPMLLNDDEIIPLLVRKGATIEEARDYTGSGYSEARLPNRNTYLTGTTWFNLAAIFEMVLHNGHCAGGGQEQTGLPTGDPCDFATYDDFEKAFFRQLDNILKSVLIQQYITDTIRPRLLGAPLTSCLHDLCMEAGKDINEGRIKGALCPGGQIGPTGFATVVDSLAAVRHLVYETNKMTMSRLLQALEANFEGYDLERQLCLSAPKYGNGDPTADAIACKLESHMVACCANHTNYYGGIPEIFLVPVTAHRAMGSITGATPDGRRAGEALSAGVSPAAGAAKKGITAILQSAAHCKDAKGLNRSSRVLSLDIPPAFAAGEDGQKKLLALIHAWRDMGLWHLEIRLQNAKELRAASNMAEKFLSQVCPFPGYAALPMPCSQDFLEALVLDN